MSLCVSRSSTRAVRRARSRTRTARSHGDGTAATPTGFHCQLEALLDRCTRGARPRCIGDGAASTDTGVDSLGMPGYKGYPLRSRVRTCDQMRSVRGTQSGERHTLLMRLLVAVFRSLATLGHAAARVDTGEQRLARGGPLQALRIASSSCTPSSASKRLICCESEGCVITGARPLGRSAAPPPPMRSSASARAAARPNLPLEVGTRQCRTDLVRANGRRSPAFISQRNSAG